MEPQATEMVPDGRDADIKRAVVFTPNGRNQCVSALEHNAGRGVLGDWTAPGGVKRPAWEGTRDICRPERLSHLQGQAGLENQVRKEEKSPRPETA